MENVMNIELMVKSERSSDTDGSTEPTYQEEAFALYARYMFGVNGSIHSAIVFVTYLFKAKMTFSTGKVTITEQKDISAVTKEDIESAISDDMEVRVNQINGVNAVNMKLNKIFHADNLPFNVSDGREHPYEVIKWSE